MLISSIKERIFVRLSSISCHWNLYIWFNYVVWKLQMLASYIGLNSINDHVFSSHQ